MGKSPRIPEALLDDPKRLLTEWIAPRLIAALENNNTLHDIRADIELELRALGTWRFELRQGAIELKEGAAIRPSIILELDGSDLAEMVLGALRPAAALVDGRLELAGDVALAMRLATLLEAVVVEI